MKILFLTSLFPNSSHLTNGIFNLSRVNALRSLGHDVKIVAPISLTPPERFCYPYPKVKRIGNLIKFQISMPAHEMIEGFDVYHPKWVWLPRRWFWRFEVDLLHLFIGNKISKILRKFNPEAIITSWLHPFGTYAKYIKKSFDVPVLSYAEGSDIFLLPEKYKGYFAIERILNKYVDKVILISKAMQELVDKRRKIDNSVLVIDGYDEDLFYFIEAPKAYKRIISVGNLSVVKGHDILIRALSKLDNNCTLTLIGDGEEKHKLQKMAQDLNVDDRIRFLGKVSHNRIINYLSDSNILCMPSRSDAQPAAAVEAFACGRPVVAANVGGFKDIIISGFNGYLSEPESPESFAYYIDKAFNTNWEYKEIADWTMANYGWKKSVKELMEVIADVLSVNEG